MKNKRIATATVLFTVTTLMALGLTGCKDATADPSSAETISIETTAIEETPVETTVDYERIVEYETTVDHGIVGDNDTQPPEETEDNVLLVVNKNHEHAYKSQQIKATCEHGGYTKYTCTCGDSYTENTTSKTSHSYSKKVVKSTCLAEGYTKYTCDVCGHSYKDNTTNKLEHSYSKKVVAPTCTKKGYTLYTCDCGDVYQEDEVDMAEHDYRETIVAPTCTEQGYTEHKCSVCNQVKKDSFIEVVPHEYTTEVTAPTCTSKGYTTYTCACGESYTGDETEKTEHVYTAEVTPPTCTKEGYTTYTCQCGAKKVADNTPKIQHECGEWISVNETTHTRSCNSADCNYTENAEHSFEKTVVEPTCQNEGYTVYACKDCTYKYESDKVAITTHNYKKVETAATCSEEGYVAFVCDCGDSYIEDTLPIAEHTYTAVTYAPTCQEDGYTLYTCACGDSYTDEVEVAKAHEYQEAETTETQDYTVYSCNVCGSVYEDKLNTLKALAAGAHTHNYEKKVIKATCTRSGYTKYTCECGDSYIAEQTPKLAHKFAVKVVPPTCQRNGYAIHSCSVCGYSYRASSICKTPHAWSICISYIDGNHVVKMRRCTRCGYTDTRYTHKQHNFKAVVTEPTCTKSGYTLYSCSCGYTYKNNFIDPIPHNYVAVVTAPTCTTKGFTTHTCSMCKNFYIDTETDVLEHKYAMEVIAPTCTKNGYTSYTCETCGDNYKESEVEKLGHEYGEWTIVKEPTALEAGSKERACSRCGEVQTTEIDKIPLDEHIMAYYKVVDGAVVDLVSGNKVTDTTINGDYFYGGTIILPAQYANWTYQMIVDYNEASTAGIIKLIKFWSNSGKYEECDNVFRLDEVNLITNRGRVRVPWVKDSWNTGYVITVPVQLYAHMSTNYEFLPSGDTFWSFSMDSENGVLNSRIGGATATTTMSTYTDSEGVTKYINKKIPPSFVLNSAHAMKELIVYDRPLTTDEQKAAYEATGIVPPTSGINQVVNGLTDMGSSMYFSKDKDGNVTVLKSETNKGTYTVTDENGLTSTYTISDYVHPDLGIDNSMYEDVNIVNEPDTIDVGKQYPLVAYPYPFNVINASGKSDQFDVTWSSSNSNILAVIDGLLIAKNTGTAKITATLTGTNISDTVTISVVKPQSVSKKTWNVPSNYVSADGYSFSDTDYAMTTRAIYAAIDEGHANGYNHVVFPKQNFYAQPLAKADGSAYWYYVPSNMTIEFPEGSVFYMVDNEVSRGDPTKLEIHYFHFGVPNNEFGTCENAHLIMDTYYGERYNTTYAENKFLEENRFVNFGRRSINCSVEIRNAYKPAGYFIVADGVSNTNKNTGVMNVGDFVSGWLNDSGEIEDNANWISTKNFITVPNYDGTGYFISAHGQNSYDGKYWNGCSARTYDILWFNENQELISIDRFNGRGDYYDIPESAAYCKVSLQQSVLPTYAEGEENNPYIAMHSDGASKMCEIKNTKVYNSATGVFSVVGQTDGLWIHDCYTNRDGMKPYNERTGDFENGWTAMRHSVVSNNSFKGYFGNHGYNTFIHTNYLENYSGASGEAELTRYINNCTDYVEISEKCQAHVFYNTLYTARVDKFATSNGYVHVANNDTGEWVRSY